MDWSESDSAPFAVDPFGPTANPAAYVPNEPSERAREALLTALDLNRSAAVVGPPGHGKTLLLHLVGDLQKQRSRVAYVPFASLGVEEFFSMVLEALGSTIDLPPVEALPVLVGELGARGGVTLLIDDAHSMQLDTAKALAKMQKAAHGDLRLVFAALEGDAAFRVLQAFGDQVELVNLNNSLSEDETRQYVEGRLAYAGARPDLVAVFDDERLAELHRDSQGVPRRLSQAAQEIVRRAAPGAMPQLRDLAHKPAPAEDDEREMSLASLAERVLSGEDAFHTRPTAAPRAPQPAAVGPDLEAGASAALEEAASAVGSGAERTEPGELELPPESDRPLAIEPALPSEPGQPLAIEPDLPPAPAPTREPEPPPAVERPIASRLERGPDAIETLPEEAAPSGRTRRSILEPDPVIADPAPAYRPAEKLPPKPPPPRKPRPSPRARTAPAEGAYRLARDPEAAAARRARAAAEFEAPPPVRQPVDPTPAPGFEGIEPRTSLWTRENAVLLSRWMAFGAGVCLAVMWWVGGDSGVDRDPGRGLTTASEVMERGRPGSAGGAGSTEADTPSVEASAQGGASGAGVDTAAPQAGTGAAGFEGLLAKPRTDPFARPEDLTPQGRGTGLATAPAPQIAVSINATPWATIEVDGRALGETPLAGVMLAPGRHVFRATMPDGRVREETIEVSRQQRAISFR